MEEWTRKSNRGTGTARVTYVIRNPHRPPPGRERPCSDHNRPTRSRSDQHVRTVTRCLGLGGQRSGAADAYGHASGSRETGRHPALRPPSTVSRPVLQGRADDFECESVLCSSQRRAESNRAVVRVCGAALRGTISRVRKNKKSRGRTLTPSLPRRVLPVASLLPVTRPRESSDGDAERGGVLPQSTRRASASPAEI